MSTSEAGFSIWEHETFYQKRDVIIVGAGIVGLQTAIKIKKNSPTRSVLVVDASAYPVGASSRNAGFACFGSVSELMSDVSTIGASDCIDLIAQRWEGLQILQETLGREPMEYKALGGFEIYNDTKQSELSDSLDYCNDLVQQAINKEQSFSLSKNTFGFSNVQHMVFNQYEGQINTGKMYYALIKLAQALGVNIWRGWAATGYESVGDGVSIQFVNERSLQCDHLVLCTNAFSRSIGIDDDIVPGRNQVMVTKPIPNLPFKSCFHYDEGYVYFRNYNDRLLIGGGRNIGGKPETTTAFGTTTQVKEYLRAIISETILPNTDYEEDFWWSGIIATGSSKQPIIKQIGSVYMGVRLGGMGVALGSLVGRTLAKLVLAKYS